MLYTRNQASDYLASKLPHKSVASWHTFLNDNARNKNHPKIPFIKKGACSLYEKSDLDRFITTLHVPEKNPTQAAEVYAMSGGRTGENITGSGKIIGFLHSQFNAYPLMPQDRHADKTLQLQIILGIENQQKRVIALSANEAQALILELQRGIDEARVIDLKIEKLNAANPNGRLMIF